MRKLIRQNIQNNNPYLLGKKNNFDDTIYLADPTIFLDKGTYYLYGTSSDNGFLVYQSKDLKK
jgi:hypothetical protein